MSKFAILEKNYIGIKFFWILLLALCLYCKGKSRGVSQVQPKGPNILLVSIDTLRPDHLGCYGYHRNTSPNIDKLALEGILFKNHISSTSWTLPAHAALFTSLSDSVHGCFETNKKLPNSLKTIAEVFKEAGYCTAGFFSGPYLHPAFGLSQGFEHYENCTSYSKSIDKKPVEDWALDTGIMIKSHRDITNPIVFTAFKGWLENNRDSKFFMFVHMWDPHFDFIPPAPYDGMFDKDYSGSLTGHNFFFNPSINEEMLDCDLQHLIALYDGEIAWTDHHIGKIVGCLKEYGLLDKTVIVITSDHGTEFFEHGNKGHRKTLFDEVIRIPLVIRYPSRLPEGVRIDKQTRIIDVAPTLVELAGLPYWDSIMGNSLVTLSLQQTADFEDIAISELFSVGHRIRSIRTLEWKLIDQIDIKKRYYINLLTDSGEHHFYTDLTQEPGRSLMGHYFSITKNLVLWRSRVDVEAERATIPDDVFEQLKSLGYIK
jgi:arylsulfatase A-like enzyme